MSIGGVSVNSQEVFELLGLCGTLLGCAWKLSDQLTSLREGVKGLADAFTKHVADNDREFERLEARVDGLTPSRRLHEVK